MEAAKGDYFESVTATSDGGFAVVGYSASPDSTGWGEAKVSSTTDGVVVKFNAKGEVLFARTYNYCIDLGVESPLRSRFFTITEDGEGNLIAAGDLQTAKSLYNSQVIKIDGKSGDQIWGRKIGSELLAAPTDGADYHTSCLVGAAALEDGSYVLAGTTKYVGDGTFELRCKLGSIITRALYFFCFGKRIVVTNGFVNLGKKKGSPILAAKIEGGRP